ncbi:hypothetical protein [Desulfosoma sp.]
MRRTAFFLVPWAAAATVAAAVFFFGVSESRAADIAPLQHLVANIHWSPP